VAGSDRVGGWLATHPGGSWLVVGAAFVVVCAGIKAAEAVVAPIVLGAYIAIVNTPLVRWLLRRKIPLSITVVLVLAADVVVMSGLAATLVAASAELSDRLPHYYAMLKEAQQHLAQRFGSLAGDGGLRHLLDPAAAIPLVASLAGDFAGVLWEVILALIIAAFLILRFGKPAVGPMGISSLLRSERAARTLREVNRYIAVKTGTSMATGLLIGLWIWLLGGELPVFFGGLAFLFNYIPNLGSFAAAAPALALGLLVGGPQHAALLGLGYALTNLVIGNIVEPRVMGRALGLWPLVVLFSVMFWGWLLGVTGAVLSALLTLVLKVLLLAVEDLRPIGLGLGPRRASIPPRAMAHSSDLLEEALPKTREG
jgi:predicted PurR-regulated permease PerM